MKYKKDNLLNNRYGKLIVIAPAGTIGKNKKIAWLCQCDCGNTKIVKAEYLKNGDTKSCGCLNNQKRAERFAKMIDKNRKYDPQEGSARDLFRRRYSDGNLLFEDFYRLIKQNCHYCGTKPKTTHNTYYGDSYSQFSQENGIIFYNGLDRVDNSKPNHDLENVVVCCSMCNLSKRERTVEEFMKWIKKVYDTSIKDTKYDI